MSSDRELIIALDPGASSVLREVSEVGTAQFFTYENMREDRDHWRGRAEVAEDELVLAIGHAKQLRAALIEVRALAVKQSGDYSPAIVSIVSGVLDGES